MQYNKDEKRCVRIIAKWFRENREFLNRSEAIEELGVDDDRYDVLIKLMEHNGVVEKVRSVMGKDGYAIAFKPSAYAEELAREFDQEEKTANEDGDYIEDHHRLGAAFARFLAREKGYPRETMRPSDKGGEPDLRIVEPVSKKPIVLIEFKVSNKQRVLQRAASDFLHYKQTEKLSNCLAYIVCPSLDKSSEPFEIYEIIDNGYESLLSINDFPAYEEFDPNTPDKKLAISDLKVGLGVDGIEIRGKIIELAGDSNIGLYAEDVDESYVNLRLEGSEQTDNVAVQIHKYGDHETTIALAVVGPKKGVEVSEPELTGFVTKGEIAKLSGYKADIPGEKAWLNGNLPKTGAREKAGVYVINSEILKNPDAWHDVEAILDLGVENIHKSPQKEPEKPKIEPEMLSTAKYAVGDSETEDDKLGFEPYVEAVAEFLVHKDTQPPLTMSVEGEWGSGKSSFMRQLKKELRRCAEKNTDRDTKPLLIDFKPWRHDKDEALWAAFALEFIRQASARLGFWERVRTNWKLRYSRFDVKEGWADVAKAVIISIAWVLATAVIVIGLWTGATVGEDGSLELPVKLGALTVVLGSVWLTFGKVKDFLGSPLDVDLRKYMKKPDYVSHVSFIEHFHKDFKDVVRTYARQQSVYVFIDDLDRCRVPKAAELMESINLMISDNPKLVFIMGMDRQKVAAGLAVKHEKLLPYLSSQVEIGSGSERNNKRMRGIRYGYSFIEKFIQIPFVLPIPSRDDIHNMLLEMAGEKEKPTEPVKRIEEPPVEQPGPKPDVPSKERKEAGRAERKETRKEVMLKFEGDDKNFRSVVLMVSEAFGNNPRRAKQFVNLFRLRIRTAASTGLITPEESQLTFVQLGKFVGIGLGWPLFIRDLEINPRLLDKLVDVAEGEIEPKDIDEKIKEWKSDERLIGLIRSGCFDENKKKKPGGEYERFSMRGLDVEKLMKVAPRVKQMEME
jgi:hypothetical protein